MKGANVSGYKGPWAFVGFAYDGLSQGMKLRVTQSFWAGRNSAGDLEALYYVMKGLGHNFGMQDPALVMVAGAEEYEEILAGQELMDGTQSG